MKAFVLVFSFAAAAFAQKVTVEFDQAADFSKYKTFAIRDGQLNSKNPALNSELVRKQIDADIQRNLTARGLTMVASGPADLNVRYHFGSARKAEIERYPAGWRGWGTRVVRVAVHVFLVIGRKSACWSTSWKASLPIRVTVSPIMAP